MTQEPTLWRDMTAEEKGALLLAHHEGKDIEAFGVSYPDMWYETDPCWDDECPYRIKPEPKRETVNANLCITKAGKSLHMRPDYSDNYYGDGVSYFTLTFDLIDGKPDPASIKIKEIEPMTTTATYSGEELSVTFVASTERFDYGVEGSVPVWEEINPDSIEIETLDILGIEVNPDILPQELQRAIHALSGEVEFE